MKNYIHETYQPYSSNHYYQITEFWKTYIMYTQVK